MNLYGGMAGQAAVGSTAGPVSDITFESLLDETCDRLLDRQVKYAVQRIDEMEKRLAGLETELDDFLRTRHQY